MFVSRRFVLAFVSNTFSIPLIPCRPNLSMTVGYAGLSFIKKCPNGLPSQPFATRTKFMMAK